MSVDLSAAVPPSDRIRLRYKITSGTLLEQHLEAAVEKINDAWRSNRDAVVFSPAVSPVVGGSSLLGVAQDLFTSLDVKTGYALRGLTWDAYLAPYRTIEPGILEVLFGGLENRVTIALDDVRELTPAEISGKLAPATRTQELEQRGQKSKAESSDLADKLAALAKTVAGRVTLLLLLVLLVIVFWQFGPAIASAITRLTSKRG